ncbi:P-loop containing nucleoside triphosphate hydrolase protein [Xylariaceae sp. FL0594]|nr:P-loop containing nucleoside triphosphate hydrolase protein [Xylariaceae sp. FL0594]
MSSHRYIDTLPAQSPEDVKEKKIIILSLSRSGTAGLCAALEQLGYKAYNMYRVQYYGYDHARMFHEALRIKRTGEGKPYSRADFDKWTGDYDVLSIVPCYLAEEVIGAYPDAKYILTTREPEAWARSVWNTIALLAEQSQSFPLALYKHFDAMDLQYSRLVELIVDGLTRGRGRTAEGFATAMEVYEDYNEKVKKLVPADKLLAVKLEDGLGWEQLCPFLGVDVPATPYPRTNDTRQFQARSKLFYQNGRRRFMRIMGTAAMLVVAAGLWYRRRPLL